MKDLDNLGRIAYEAYGESREWTTFNGDPMPTWADQSPEISKAWEAAAQAVEREVSS